MKPRHGRRLDPGYHGPCVALLLLALAGLARGGEPPTDWAARIRATRQSPLTIRLVDRDTGAPLAGMGLTLRQTEARFRFGTCLRADKLWSMPEDHPYKTHAKRLFNAAVFGNSHKWTFFERPDWRAREQVARRWTREAGLPLRGHALLWQTRKYGGVYPPDVVAAIERDDEVGRTYIRQRVARHIQSTTRELAEVVYEWDVANETVRWHEIADALHPEADFRANPALAEWFTLAREASPNTRLVLNEYHILVGDFRDHKNSFEAIARDLLKRGAPLGGLGFQGHYHAAKLARTRAQLWETLERFGALGLPMLITEFDMYGPGWGETQAAAEARQAEFFEDILTVAFAHPRMEGFFVWGFWDGIHWNNSAPFYRKDWRPKPALAVFERLAHGAWRTPKTTLTTNARGEASLEGFHGAYECNVTAKGEPRTFSLILPKGGATLTFVIDKE